LKKVRRNKKIATHCASQIARLFPQSKKLISIFNQIITWDFYHVVFVMHLISSVKNLATHEISNMTNNQRFFLVL